MNYRIRKEGRARNPERWQSGFTLWELLLVLFLTGMILTLATPHFSSAPNLANIHVDRANKERIAGAVQLYRLDVGVYPGSVSDLICAPEGVFGWRGPYLEEIPRNPLQPVQGYQINALGQVQ